jgi:cell division topological specificity factor
MSILNLFRRRGSAPLARERLQILLSHERTAGNQPDLLAILREEILTTIARQITVERENVRVRIDRGANVSTLEIDVDIPHLVGTVPTLLGRNSSVRTTGVARHSAKMANFSHGLV